MIRSASATWTGNLKEGKGTISTESAALKNIPYGFNTRFENTPGSNPEELIAAAHAGCFTMALSAFLGRAGFTPKKLVTQASVSLEQIKDSWTVTSIRLEVNADIPDITHEAFQEIAANAKENCPISRLLNTMITLEAKLESV